MSQTRAHLVRLEEFGDSFREEWKQKKKESIERRHVFLERKSREVEKDQSEFRPELRKAAKEVGLRIGDKQVDELGTGQEPNNCEEKKKDAPTGSESEGFEADEQIAEGSKEEEG